MADLPIELISEILERLPVKSLLRFRCVSKRWRTTIDSRCFAKSHLSRSVESSTNLSLFLQRARAPSLYCIDMGSMRSVVEMNYPLRRNKDQIKVLGSCHGLLCISNAADDVVIWNPSTGKHKFLPSSAVDVRRGPGVHVCVYGFGYDDGNDDYMLLRLVLLFVIERERIESEVSIYSLRNNAWKRLHDMPYSLVYANKMGVFACGRLHWIMSRRLDSGKLLVAFDFRIEDFQVVDQPDVIDNKLERNVAVLGGCLCLTINKNEMGVDVWIMKDYGLKESWAKLFSITQTEVARPLGYVQPLAYSQNRREVLVRRDRRNLVWYDLETKCIKKVCISGMPSYFEPEICLRTLVSVDDYGGERKRAAGKACGKGRWKVPAWKRQRSRRRREKDESRKP